MIVKLTPAPTRSGPYHVLHNCLGMDIEICLSIATDLERLDALSDHLVKKTNEVVCSCFYRAFMGLDS